MRILENLGSNSGNLTPEELKKMGFGRIETSLGKQKSYEDMKQQNLEDLAKATALGLKTTIHLPIYIDETWEKYEYFDGFFLDRDPQMRELSFQQVAMNLSKLVPEFSPEYYILHFPGLYAQPYGMDNFEEILDQSLNRLNHLGKTYGVTFALEYLASNDRFKDYHMWIEKIEPYEHLGILLDTGHLYFACLMNDWNYDEILHGLAPHCIGFHVWNIQGKEAYGKSAFYQQYHHVVPHLEQRREAGWAFNTEEVMLYLASFEKPVIIEALTRYKGDGYYREGLEGVHALIEEMLQK